MFEKNPALGAIGRDKVFLVVTNCNTVQRSKVGLTLKQCLVSGGWKLLDGSGADSHGRTRITGGALCGFWVVLIFDCCLAAFMVSIKV